MPRAIFIRLLCWLAPYSTVFPIIRRFAGIRELSAITGHIRQCWCCKQIPETVISGLLLVSANIRHNPRLCTAMAGDSGELSALIVPIRRTLALQVDTYATSGTKVVISSILLDSIPYLRKLTNTQSHGERLGGHTETI